MVAPTPRNSKNIPMLAIRLFRLLSHSSERGIAEGVTMVVSLAVTTAMVTAIATNGIQLVERIGLTVDSTMRALHVPVDHRGTVLATAHDHETVSQLRIPIALRAGDARLPADSTEAGSLIVSYRDSRSFASAISYRLEEIRGNGDSFVDPHELFHLVVDPGMVELPDGHAPFVPGEAFTIEIRAPGGGATMLTRALPPILQNMMALH